METLKPTPLFTLLLLLLLTLAAAVAATANASARKTGPPVPVSVDASAAPSTSPSDMAEDSATSASAAGAAAAPSTSSSDVADDAAASASASEQPPISFFMHDVLGGANPSARIVSGIVDNTAVNGQLPFARPNGAVLPFNGGVSVSGGAGNGAVDNNNLPFLTGLGGTTNAVTQTNGNGNGNGVANGLPFFAGGNLPEGTSLQKLLFGTLTVMDDELTEGPELGSGVVGKAQGFYVASSEEGTSQTVALTAMLTAGDYADSISLFGVHRTAESESYLAVVGGTGKYAGAKGFAKVAVVRTPAAAHETDGVESVLQFTVYLSAY
ncbi:dirigent protein 25-like [Ananas comosus]|uniref:Dirigent protein n=1 Tax=Ananas comosus TaxID=4615 RepID=A0A6P5GDL6_ANACO|nr:dirigent protein 25-like [Ananas comosus]